MCLDYMTGICMSIWNPRSDFDITNSMLRHILDGVDGKVKSSRDVGTIM